MYICICNAVTDSHIQKAVEDGVRTYKQLSKATGCGSTCGSCQQTAKDLLHQALSDNRETSGLLPVMQTA